MSLQVLGGCELQGRDPQPLTTLRAGANQLSGVQTLLPDILETVPETPTNNAPNRHHLIVQPLNILQHLAYRKDSRLIWRLCAEPDTDE